MNRSMRAATALLVATSCAFGGTAATAFAAPTTTASTSTTASTLSPQAKAAIEKLRAALPKDHAARLEAKLARLGVDSEWLDLANAAASGETCNDDTPFGRYIGETLDGVNFEIMDAIGMAGGFSMPVVDALFYLTGDDPQSFGRDGEYTTAVTHTYRDLQRFWDIPSQDINTVALHGRDVFTDRARAARAIAFMYGISTNEAQGIADQIIALIGEEPILEDGAHPLFSLNAIAISTKSDPDPEIAALPDRVLMGDGLMEIVTGIGLGDAAIKNILAHEFGHQVQYAKHLMADEGMPTPEESRRIELMADAFSGYYLAHARGQAMNAKRIVNAATAAWNVGDCRTTSPGHHGTPNQRKATSLWAADLANAARPQGSILPSDTFVAKFEAALPELLEN